MGLPLNINLQQILLHLLNFVILAGGLYLLLYGPVKKFMVSREEHYKKMDEEANKKLKEAEESRLLYDKRLEEADKEIAIKKAEGVKQAQVLAEARIAAANEEGRKIVEKAKANAGYEKEKILAQANAEIETMVSEAVDKMLASKTGDPFDDFLNSVGEAQAR